MKDLVLILREHHLPIINPAGRIIHKTITAWLTKELRK